MKKRFAVALTFFAAFLSPGSAHSGLYHSYTGFAVAVLMILLWTTLALYDRWGDTFTGHWALFSGLFLSAYVPITYPHSVIDLPGVFIGVAGVFLIGAVTCIHYYRH